MLNLNEENFKEEVLESKIPVLVDFWASWCGPCQMMGPIIEELAQELEGKIKVCKLNIEEGKNLSSEYQVMSIPTFIIFKEGKEVVRTVGARSKEDLKKWIEENIK